jgi:hypothetical protein
MKKYLSKFGAGVVTIAAALGISAQAQAHVTLKQGIANLQENSPLYLDQAPGQTARGEVILAWHYSHSSHASHASHQSHYSHYSGS